MLWLLAGWRIDLLEIGGSSVRVEDLIILALLPTGYRGFRNSRWRQVSRAFVWLVAASIASVVFGVLSERVEFATAILFGSRPLEYSVVLFAALELAGRPGGRAAAFRVLVAVTVAQSIATALGLVGLLNVSFSKFSGERAAGLTAGPYELGAMAAALVIYWAIESRPLMLGMSLFMLFASASRASLFAVIVVVTLLVIASVFSRSQAPRFSRRIQTVVGLSAILGALGMGLIASGVGDQSAIFTRITSTDVVQSWRDAESVTSSDRELPTSQDYRAFAFGDTGTAFDNLPNTDASTFVRFVRWQTLLYRQFREIDAVFFGLGPSFAGPSVDGSLLRTFVEIGFVGSAVWVAIYVNLLKQSCRMGIMVLGTYFVGSLFIDLMSAMRPTLLIYFILGVAAVHAPPSGGKDLRQSRLGRATR